MSADFQLIQQRTIFLLVCRPITVTKNPLSVVRSPLKEIETGY